MTESFAELTDKVADLGRVEVLCDGAFAVVTRHIVNLEQFAHELGVITLPHNKHGQIVWDIKPIDDQGSVELTRSHTMAPFDLHTDASFDAVPPPYFMVQIVEPDRYGGGRQQFLPIDKVLAGLSTVDRDILSDDLLDWSVPLEFRDLEEVTHLPAIFLDKTGAVSLRFRDDRMIEHDLTDRLRIAFSGLKDAIDLARDEVIEYIPYRGEILFVDNYHTLHGRSTVEDRQRHLRRIRFDLGQTVDIQPS